MRSLLITSALVGACVLLTAGTAGAVESTILHANVPFPFLVNGQLFPAGQYSVEEDVDSSSSVLLIRGMHGPSATFVSTHPAGGKGPGEPALRFQRQDDHYRLASIWETPREGQTIVIARR